jgi:NMD protein affecting ribosome stability and mRNA decay
MQLEKCMTASEGGEPAAAAPPRLREVRMGEPECPRCRKSFTASYWSGGVLVQARCLSCDLKWPLPDVV